jgi:hypothetical protein
MADIKIDLRDLEKGLKCIELAQKNGLLVVPRGTELSVKRDPEFTDYDDAEAKTVFEMLKSNRDDILAVTKDPEILRQTLSQAQERMAEANRWLLVQIDLFDRLEKAYRVLFPSDKGCVRGDAGCLDDAVVRCTACQDGNLHWVQGGLNGS